MYYILDALCCHSEKMSYLFLNKKHILNLDACLARESQLSTAFKNELMLGECWIGCVISRWKNEKEISMCDCSSFFWIMEDNSSFSWHSTRKNLRVTKTRLPEWFTVKKFVKLVLFWCVFCSTAMKSAIRMGDYFLSLVSFPHIATNWIQCMKS